MEILAALAGAIVGSLVTIIWERLRLPSRLLNVLRAELIVNRELCQRSISINKNTLEQFSLKPKLKSDQTIDDDFKVYVVMPINIPLETWVNQDSSLFKRKIPIQLFLRYKTALARVEYLISRHQAFRFRPNFISAIVDAHEKLLSIIEDLDSALKQ